LLPLDVASKILGMLAPMTRAGKSGIENYRNSTIEERVVENAFGYLRTVSQIIRERFNL